MGDPQKQRDELAKQRGESDRAITSAASEWRGDKNRTDPKHTQERMDAAAHELRVRMGLEKE